MDHSAFHGLGAERTEAGALSVCPYPWVLRPGSQEIAEYAFIKRFDAIAEFQGVYAYRRSGASFAYSISNGCEKSGRKCFRQTIEDVCRCHNGVSAQNVKKVNTECTTYGCSILRFIFDTPGLPRFRELYLCWVRYITACGTST